MSTPQQQPQKGPRRSAKKQPGQNSRMAVSDNEAYNTSINQIASEESKNRPRRKSQAHRKNNNHNNSHGAHSDAAAHSDSQTQRNTPHAKTLATPIKSQAYAGPTFHHSPAASALPLPSFYSKSLPAAGFMKPVLENDSRPSTQGALPTIHSPTLETKRESTPLDFLFDAARKAQTIPGAESPHRSYLSAAGTPSSRSPAAREHESEFPFEMDSTDKATGEEYSAFSTPYKDRIEALKSTRSTSEGGKSLDDSDRVAKTAALKKFLLSSAQINEGGAENPFNARSAPSPPNRHRSNPSTPMHNVYGNHHNQQYFPQMALMQNGPMSPSQRPPSSNLRNIYAPHASGMPAELSSDNSRNEPLISTARDHHTPARQPYVHNFTTPPPQPREQRSTPSAQQLEDDLRRVLKLDLVGRG